MKDAFHTFRDARKEKTPMSHVKQNCIGAQSKTGLLCERALFLVMILGLGTLPRSTGFEPPTKSGSPTPQSELSTQLVQRITDTAVPVSERLATLYRVLENESERRNAVLFEVVRSGDEAVASEAAVFLVQPTTRMSAEVMGTIARRIIEWRDSAQHLVLQYVHWRPDNADLMDIPRAVLQGVVASGEPPAIDEGTQTTAVDRAAWILSSSTDPKDDDLLRSALAIVPSNRDVWLSLAHRHALTDAERSLARRVYRNTSAPLVYRVAAAVAVAEQDNEAFDFALRSITDLLAQFGNLGLDSIGPSRDDERMAARYHQMKEHLVAVAMLMFLDERRAEETTFRWINSRNPLVNRVVGLVAARRWPERFLREVRDLKFEHDYALLLAAVGHFHPEFSGQASKRVPADEFQTALETVSKRAAAAHMREADRIILGW